MHDKIFGCIQAHNSFVIAYSGGLDSHVLLHTMFVLRTQQPAMTIQAVHINHQLNAESSRWATHCQSVCDALTIPIHIEKITLNLEPGDSLEEKAREARYAILKKYTDKNSVLLTAHHLNDQAETFLLQALRGAGSKGLSAMPVKKTWGASFLIRPLLNISRDALEKYANDHRLQWIEDDSNTDPRFRRNFLRHEVFPLLKKQCPAVMENFARCAQLMADNEKIISDVINLDFEIIQTDDIGKIDLKKLQEFSEQKQKLLLRHWFSHNKLRMPSAKHLAQILQDVVQAGPQAKPLFSVEKYTIKRDRRFLYLVPKLTRLR